MRNDSEWSAVDVLCVMNSNSKLEPASKELERVSCQVREHFAEKTWTGVGTQCQFFSPN